MKELTFEMIEPYINKYRNDCKYVIYCNTKEKTEKLFKVLNLSKYLSLSMYEEDICHQLYYNNNKINWTFSSKNYFQKNYNSTIIKFDDLFKEKENKMNIENGYIELNGNRVELTKEQMEKLFGKDNPYEYKENEIFFHSSSDFEIYSNNNILLKNDLKKYKTGNYCRNKDLKTQDSLHDLLRSKLRKFSMLNGGLDIDWSNETDHKYFIFYNYKNNNYKIFSNLYNKQDSIYFINAETAQRAINEVIIPFEKEHLEFTW